MKLIKITFLIIGLICSFVLQTMEPEQARALEQQEEYRYAAGAKQKMEQTPHMDLVWSKLAHEYYATGQIDPNCSKSSIDYEPKVKNLKHLIILELGGN